MVPEKNFCVTIARIIKRDRNGFALLYVMGTLLIVTFIGSALINISHQDVISATDYSAMTSAAISAKSAIQAAVARFEHESQAAINILNNFRNDAYSNDDKGWLLGTSNTYVTLNDQQQYSARIVGFDKSNFSVQIEGTGLGKGGSKKKVVGVYILNGIEFQTTTTIGNQKALYFSGAMDIYARLTITGCFYAEDNIDFVSWCTGSDFDGPFICNGTAKFAGQYTFQDAVYFNQTVDIETASDGSVGIIINGMSGFESLLDVTYSTPAQTITMHDDAYFNGNFVGTSKIDNLNNHDFYHDGGVSDPASHISNYGAITNYGGQIDIPAELGVPASMTVPAFHEDAIPGGLIYNWNTITGNAMYISGNELNAIWTDANTNGNLWNGFAVVDVSAGTTIYPIRDDGTFTENIIILNHGTINQLGINNLGWPHCAEGSVTVIYNQNHLYWGQNVWANDTYRGYVYNDSLAMYFNIGNSASIRLREIIGAVHDRDPTPSVNQFHPDDVHHDCHIVYDETLMNQLAATGLVTNVGGTAGVINTNTLIISVPSVGITTALAGLCF